MTKRILLLCVLAIGGLAAFGATPAFAASTAVTQNAWFQNQNRIIEVNNRVRVSWNYNGGTVSNGRCQWTWSKLNFWSLSGRATNCLYEQNHHRVHGWQTTTFTSTRFCPNHARTTVSDPQRRVRLRRRKRGRQRRPSSSRERARAPCSPSDG